MDRKRIIEDNPQSPLLERREAYFWICPPSSGRLEIKDEAGLVTQVSKRQMIFPEDYMKGLGLSKKRLLLNNSEITQDFLKTVALLKQNRGIVSNSS